MQVVQRIGRKQVTRSALITGVTGQDGSYLAEFLLERGYAVSGMSPTIGDAVADRRVDMHYCDLSDGSNLPQILDAANPDEVYNLAGQSQVRVSFDLPVHTADVTGLGAIRVLEAVRQFELRSGKHVRFFEASSSEMFGSATGPTQNEHTPIHPRSPYACAKAFAYWQTVNYREAYDLFACNGILFNHESPRRGLAFVTRKITSTAARIKFGLENTLYLGNLEARRDWGFAGDVVEAMWLMLQQDHPDDYVIATGETHSVREFLDEVFGYLDLDWHDYVEIDPRFYRPTDIDVTCGDSSKARRVLGWEPRVSFQELARLMIEADLRHVQAELKDA